MNINTVKAAGKVTAKISLSLLLAMGAAGEMANVAEDLNKKAGKVNDAKGAKKVIAIGSMAVTAGLAYLQFGYYNSMFNAVKSI